MSKSNKSRWVARLITAAALLAAVLVFVRLLPQGFSDDLSRIGQGKAVAVLLDYRFSVQSQEMMGLLNGIRGDYADSVEFLVVDADSERGRRFSERHQARGATLVLFSPDGEPSGVLRNISGEKEARAALDSLRRIR